MRDMTGRVIDGKIEVSDEIEDGTAVAVVAADDDEFRLTPEEEDELSNALVDIRAGNYVDGRELLRALKESSGR